MHGPPNPKADTPSQGASRPRRGDKRSGRFEQTPEAVVVKVLTPAGEETVTARYVVAADGGRGAIRKAIGVPFLGENPSLDGILIADVKVEGLDRDFWHVWATPAGQKVTLCPMPSTDGFQFAAFVSEGAEPVQDLATLQALLDAAMAPAAAYRISDMTWISLFRPNVRMASRFSKGWIFLVGDAAQSIRRPGPRGSTPPSRTPTIWAGSSAGSAAAPPTRACSRHMQKNGCRSPRRCCGAATSSTRKSSNRTARQIETRTMDN